MAPRKRRSGDSTAAPPPKSKSGTLTRRVTRSSTAAASAGLPVASSAEPPKKKGKKLSKEKEASEKAPSSDIAEAPAVIAGSKTVVIEHCKQCNSFKTRAIQVKNGLEKGVSGITVLVNPEKPRRGCFEIREEGGEKFITLLDMKRPFTKMKELDMDKVISDIVLKIK